MIYAIKTNMMIQLKYENTKWYYKNITEDFIYEY